MIHCEFFLFLLFIYLIRVWVDRIMKKSFTLFSAQQLPGVTLPYFEALPIWCLKYKHD